MKEKRAEYGKEIVAALSRQLTDDYGNNFNEKNLRRMVQFAEVFPDEQIVVSLIRQLTRDGSTDMNGIKARAHHLGSSFALENPVNTANSSNSTNQASTWHLT